MLSMTNERTMHKRRRMMFPSRWEQTWQTNATVSSYFRVANAKRWTNSSIRKTLRDRSTSGKISRRPCKDHISGKCTNTSCHYWHPPVCQNYKQNGDANSVKSALLRTEEITVSPAKKVKTDWWFWICCHIEEFQVIYLRLPGNRVAEIQFDFTEGHKILGSTVQRAILKKVHYVKWKFGKRKDPSQGMIQHAGSHDRSLYAPKYEDRSGEELLLQERCVRRDAWEMTKRHFQAQRQGHSYVLLPSEVWKRICWGFRISMHMLDRKDMNSVELETVRVSRNPTTDITVNREVQTNEEAAVYVCDLDLCSTAQILEGTPVLSLGKQCEHHGTPMSGLVVKNHIKFKTVKGASVTSWSYDMDGHAKKCVERYRQTVQSSNCISSPHHVLTTIWKEDWKRWVICQTSGLKLSWNSCIWHALVDRTSNGRWTN